MRCESCVFWSTENFEGCNTAWHGKRELSEIEQAGGSCSRFRRITRGEDGCALHSPRKFRSLVLLLLRRIFLPWLALRELRKSVRITLDSLSRAEDNERVLRSACKSLHICVLELFVESDARVSNDRVRTSFPLFVRARSGLVLKRLNHARRNTELSEVFGEIEVGRPDVVERDSDVA